MLLHKIVKLFSSAEDSGTETAIKNDGTEVTVPCTQNGPAAAFVFKTVADPFVGKMSYVKVVSGVIKNDQTLLNMTTDSPEKIGKILIVKGKKQEECFDIVQQVISEC